MLRLDLYNQYASKVSPSYNYDGFETFQWTGKLSNLMDFNVHSVTLVLV